MRISLKKIFGEIQDEHDAENENESQIDERTFLFSGRSEIDHLIDQYNLPIEESDEFETLAGFVLWHLEEIPQPNESFETEKLIFTVI